MRRPWLGNVLSSPSLVGRLCVHLADSAYSTLEWIQGVDQYPHAVHISRLRSNRVLYRLPEPEPVRRGPRRKYGTLFRLSDPPPPEEIEEIALANGHHMRISRWRQLLAKRGWGHPFDVIRVEVFSGSRRVYAKGLWLLVTGRRRSEISSMRCYWSYTRRFDLEHFFRFQKQRIVLTHLQTPNTRHEENAWWLSLFSYWMLYCVKDCARYLRRPWEPRAAPVKPLSPSQVQRDYERIIRQIGTPACDPKPRGISPGRALGTRLAPRPDCPVVHKGRRYAMRC